MFDKRILKTLGVVSFALVVLAGCRQEEQGRPLHYEPGVSVSYTHLTLPTIYSV